MDLRQLECFRVAARTGSITAAARELHISQPALSMTISRLEEDLGVHLFDRISGKILLNSMGKSLLTNVERIFLELGGAALQGGTYGQRPTTQGALWGKHTRLLPVPALLLSGTIPRAGFSSGIPD